MNEPKRAAHAHDTLERLIQRMEHGIEAAGSEPMQLDVVREYLRDLREVTTGIRALDDDALLHRTRAELRETRDRLQSLVQAMPIILWALDPDGTITLSEGRALEFLGLRAGELVGQSVYAIYQAFPEAIAAIQRGLSGEDFGAEVEVGGRIWSNRYFPHVVDGRVVTLTGLSIDVTESKQLEDAARNLEEQVRHAQKLESLGVLAGGIAHDFNNLLSVILGNIELALRKLEPGSAARPKVESAERAAIRASELTHQLLVYAGKSRTRFERVGMNALVTELAQLLGTVVAKNATIEYDLADSLPAIEADTAQLRQVVMNLITNASDALDGRPGTIRLSTGCVVDDAVASYDDAALQPSTSVYLEVRDSGVGMSEATLARIFDPFFTTKFTGRGLGLAAVSGIVRGHRGSMSVTSRLGEGTCFRIVLPAAAPTLAPQEPEPARRLASAAAMSGVVLLVDDEREVRESIRDLLVDVGFEVIEASSAAEALDVAAREGSRIAAAVIDVVMPEVNGHQLHDSLHARGHHLPVVLISGFEQESPVGAPGDDGPAPIVQKPFSTDALLEALRRAGCKAPERSSADAPEPPR